MAKPLVLEDLFHIVGLKNPVEARDFIVQAGALVTTMMNMENQL